MESFSLVIGSYNPNKEWLQSAVDSAQGLFDEIILVDDGSTEPISGITGVGKIIRKENGGFYTARNAGIEQANGSIICSLDDDDLFIREAVLDMKAIANNNIADVYSFEVKFFGDVDFTWNKEVKMQDIFKANQIPSGSWFRKDLWERIGGFQYHLAEDWDFWCRAWKANALFLHAPLEVYLHRAHADSVSMQWDRKQLKEINERMLSYE